MVQTRSQFYVRAQRREGEAKRRELREQGLLDRTLRPRTEGEFILLPVTEPLPGVETGDFNPVPGIPLLPRHELIGGIAVMQEEDVAGAATLLASRPSLHTVLYPESDVEGEFRTRRFKVLAGEKTTRTLYVEHGLRLAIDLSCAYFSGRLSTERQRILSMMADQERVLDMFAGVGPFAITLSRKAGFVAAADINPCAVHLLIENIARSHAGNVLPLFFDAARLCEVLPWRFDRIVMNLPLGAAGYLSGAVPLCREGGTLHCYALVEREGEMLSDIMKFPVREVRERYVRSYSPGRWHAVYDITLE
ncbi:MAG: RsmD family RNA methyltransferase [Methanolinea sp.]|nr:RsmD family RNA methyltransferase [Methanolinea sp.]